MALAEVQAILEGLRQHQAKVTAANEQKIQQQRVDLEKESQQKRIDLETQKLEQEKKVQDNQIEIAKKAADLIHMQKLQEIGTQFQQTGVSPAGASVSPAASTVPNGQANYSPINPQQATSNILQFPGGGSVEVPTLGAQAKTQAAAKETLMEPEVKAKIRESQAVEAERLKKVEESKAYDFQRMAMMKVYDDKRAAEMKAADDARERYRQEQENYRARLRLQSDAPDLSPYVMMGLNGEMTQEDVMKLPLKTPDKMKIVNGVVAPGGRLLNNSSKQSLTDMSTISTAIPHIDGALAELKNHPVEVRIPGTDSYKRYQEEVKQAELVLPQVGRVIAGDKGRMSNQQIKYAEGSFLPSRNPLTTDFASNVKNREDFVRTMNDIMDTHLKGMSDQHKAYLKQTFGIKPLTPFIASPVAGQAPQGQAPPQQQPAPSFKITATGQGGHKIGSNDGVTWFDVQTGKQLGVQ